MRKFLFIVHLLSICSPLSASNYDNYIRTYYSTNDGLTHNEITSITKDAYGFMWIGTRGGLNRFDGYSFKHYKSTSDDYSLSNPSIERLYTDSKNQLWVGTKSGGATKYNNTKE